MISFYNENLTYQLFNEILPLLNLSREEVYDIKENKLLSKTMKLSYDEHNVDINHFLNKQVNNMLHISTIRDNGKLIGYWVLNMSYHNQNKDLLTASCSNIHILKEYRKNDIAVKFIKFTEEQLKTRGVKIIYFGVNPQLKTDRLLRRIGYKLDEVIMTKEI